ncbi:MAG: hypothetical protein ACTTGZ_10040 [Treponema sp.]
MTVFLIFAVSVNHNFAILTLDKDFENYKKYIEIDLINGSEWANK